MTSPHRYLTRMVIFMAIAIAVVGVLYQPVTQAFLANAALNGLIIGAMVLGVLYIFRQVWMLNAEVAWIEAFRSQRPGVSMNVMMPLITTRLR